MNRYIRSLVWAVAFCSAASNAEDIKLRGFASFVGGMTPSADEAYLDYDNHFNLQPDSLVGLQFDADLGDKLSATVQILGRGNENYNPDFEWAYMTYEFTDSLQLSAGKIRVPFYRYSDFFDVRYAYLWVQAPREVYGFDFSGFDGMSLLHTAEIAGWDSSFQLVFAQYNDEIAGAEATIEDLTGFSWTVNRDWLTLRAGYFQSNTTIELDDISALSGAVTGVADGTGANLSSINDDILIDSDSGSFMGLAVGIDYSNILVDAEYIEYEIEDSFLPKTTAYYLSFGYRFDKITPYLVKSNQTAEAEDNLSGQVPASIASIPVIPTEFGAITLPQFLSGAVAGTEVDDDSLELGFRYDFHPSAAFKASVMQREDINGDDTTLYRVAIDLVF